jgi:hypothetical protein
MHLFKIKNDSEINTYVELWTIDDKNNILNLINELRNIDDQIRTIIDSNFYLQFAHEYTNYNDYFKKVEERIIIKELYVILKIIDYKPEVREIYNKYKITYYREREVQ